MPSDFTQIKLQWRGFLQTIALPHFITFKQLWLWLAYFTTRKIIHSNCLQKAECSSTDASANQLQATQLAQLVSIVTHEGLDIRRLPHAIGQSGDTIQLRVSCPSRSPPQHKSLSHQRISPPSSRFHPYPDRPSHSVFASPFLQQPQLIPNFTLVELYTNSGRLFSILAPYDMPLSDIVVTANIQAAAPPQLLPFHQGEPCHHRNSPLYTLHDRLVSPIDCDPIIIRGCKRPRNNFLLPSDWAAQVARDLAGYTTSIAVFLTWLARTAEARAPSDARAHQPDSRITPSIIITITILLLLSLHPQAIQATTTATSTHHYSPNHCYSSIRTTISSLLS